ncbi:hypothetical protein ACJ2PR_34720, partial [Phormidesmis sp. 146-33]
APLRTKLWFMGSVIRLGLSKLLPFVSPPIAFSVRNPQYSYRELWLGEQRTSRILSATSWLGLIGFLGIVVLLLQC